MAKAKQSPEAAAAVAAALTAAGNTAGAAEVVKGKTELNPAIPTDKQIEAKEKADAAAAKKAEADKVKADKAAAAAEKKAEADKLKEAKKVERDAAKADREARIAQLKADGKNYTGSMLALADRVKQGLYVTGATGQLRSTNELAEALDGVSPTDVVRIGLDMLKLEDNPYVKLNVGQQSMNLRNRMRGAIKREEMKIADIAEYIERNKIHVITKADLEAKVKERADKIAASQAAKAKTAENKAAKAVESKVDEAAAAT